MRKWVPVLGVGVLCVGMCSAWLRPPTPTVLPAVAQIDRESYQHEPCVSRLRAHDGRWPLLHEAHGPFGQVSCYVSWREPVERSSPARDEALALCRRLVPEHADAFSFRLLYEHQR